MSHFQRSPLGHFVRTPLGHRQRVAVEALGLGHYVLYQRVSATVDLRVARVSDGAVVWDVSIEADPSLEVGDGLQLVYSPSGLFVGYHFGGFRVVKLDPISGGVTHDTGKVSNALIPPSGGFTFAANGQRVFVTSFRDEPSDPAAEVRMFDAADLSVIGNITVPNTNLTEAQWSRTFGNRKIDAEPDGAIRRGGVRIAADGSSALADLGTSVEFGVLISAAGYWYRYDTGGGVPDVRSSGGTTANIENDANWGPVQVDNQLWRLTVNGAGDTFTLSLYSGQSPGDIFSNLLYAGTFAVSDLFPSTIDEVYRLLRVGAGEWAILAERGAESKLRIGAFSWTPDGNPTISIAKRWELAVTPTASTYEYGDCIAAVPGMGVHHLEAYESGGLF